MNKEDAKKTMIKELFERKPIVYGRYNDIELLRYFVEKNRLEYVIYGSGDMAFWFENWIKRQYGICPVFFLDRKPQTNCIDEIDVISMDELLKMKGRSFFVAVAEEEFEEKEYRRDLSNELKKGGASIIFDAQREKYAFWPDWYAWIYNHAKEFDIFANKLEDDLSVEQLRDYLSVYIDGEKYKGKVFSEKFKYWGIDDYEHRLFELNGDDVILNLGGCTGDTIFQYISNGLPFKRIISVEASEGNCKYINRSISLLEEGIKERIQVECVYIDKKNKLDKLFGKEGITLIEMDIEGAELEALRGAEKIIKNNRPILSICAYHQKDDLITIPRYLEKICKDYVYILRKYPSQFFPDYQCVMQVNELVLYAIPKERYVNKNNMVEV